MSVPNISEHGLVEIVKKGKEDGILITEEAWELFKNIFDIMVDSEKKHITIKSKIKDARTSNGDLKTYGFYEQINRYKSQIVEKIERW